MKVSQPLAVTLPEFGVVFAESVHAADFAMAERVDRFHKLLYVLAGRVSYRATARPAQIRGPGGVLVVPAGVRHRLQDLAPSTLLLLGVAEPVVANDPDLRAVWSTLESAPLPLALARPARDQVERIWRRAMLEQTHGRPGARLLVRTLAGQLIILLAREQRTPTAREAAAPRVAAVARELRETFFEDWPLDRAAQRAGLSRRRFTELFRAATGRSFAEELTELRLAHAARLLRGSAHSVLGVMFSCGFSDVSHFYRLFRRRYGAPPKRWRDQAVGGRS